MSGNFELHSQEKLPNGTVFLAVLGRRFFLGENASNPRKKLEPPHGDVFKPMGPYHGQNPFRTTFIPWETIVSWYLQENHQKPGFL